MVILKAYAHQVGGHSQLVKFEDSSNKVFKPLQENEFQFYESLLSLQEQATAVPSTMATNGNSSLPYQVPQQQLQCDDPLQPYVEDRVAPLPAGVAITGLRRRACPTEAGSHRHPLHFDSTTVAAATNTAGDHDVSSHSNNCCATIDRSSVINDSSNEDCCLVLSVNASERATTTGIDAVPNVGGSVVYLVGNTSSSGTNNYDCTAERSTSNLSTAAAGNCTSSTAVPQQLHNSQAADRRNDIEPSVVSALMTLRAFTPQYYGSAEIALRTPYITNSMNVTGTSLRHDKSSILCSVCSVDGTNSNTTTTTAIESTDSSATAAATNSAATHRITGITAVGNSGGEATVVRSHRVSEGNNGNTTHLPAAQGAGSEDEYAPVPHRGRRFDEGRLDENSNERHSSCKPHRRQHTLAAVHCGLVSDSWGNVLCAAAGDNKVISSNDSYPYDHPPPAAVPIVQSPSGRNTLLSSTSSPTFNGSSNRGNSVTAVGEGHNDIDSCTALPCVLSSATVSTKSYIESYTANSAHRHTTTTTTAAPNSGALVATQNSNKTAPAIVAAKVSNGEVYVRRYIVLQDLLYQFKKPCVIDIKMGRRQRKLGATSEKEKRQLEKSLRTTSNQLGFRICGLQSYNRVEGQMGFRDKYWGRRLTKERVPEAIRLWFWNGKVLYADLIPLVLAKLNELYDCVAQLKHYRFWCSSLLWVYDGGLSDPFSRSKSLDIKMIDFANSTVVNEDPQVDLEYLYGLRSLIEALHEILQTPPNQEPYLQIPHKSRAGAGSTSKQESSVGDHHIHHHSIAPSSSNGHMVGCSSASGIVSTPGSHQGASISRQQQQQHHPQRHQHSTHQYGRFSTRRSSSMALHNSAHQYHHRSTTTTPATSLSAHLTTTTTTTVVYRPRNSTTTTNIGNSGAKLRSPNAAASTDNTSSSGLHMGSSRLSSCQSTSLHRSLQQSPSSPTAPVSTHHHHAGLDATILLTRQHNHSPPAVASRPPAQPSVAIEFHNDDDVANRTHPSVGGSNVGNGRCRGGDDYYPFHVATTLREPQHYDPTMGVTLSDLVAARSTAVTTTTSSPPPPNKLITCSSSNRSFPRASSDATKSIVAIAGHGGAPPLSTATSTTDRSVVLDASVTVCCVTLCGRTDRGIKFHTSGEDRRRVRHVAVRRVAAAVPLLLEAPPQGTVISVANAPHCAGIVMQQVVANDECHSEKRNGAFCHDADNCAPHAPQPERGANAALEIELSSVSCAALASNSDVGEDRVVCAPPPRTGTAGNSMLRVVGVLGGRRKRKSRMRLCLRVVTR